MLDKVVNLALHGNDQFQLVFLLLRRRNNILEKIECWIHDECMHTIQDVDEVFQTNSMDIDGFGCKQLHQNFLKMRLHHIKRMIHQFSDIVAKNLKLLGGDKLGELMVLLDRGIE